MHNAHNNHFEILHFQILSITLSITLRPKPDDDDHGNDHGHDHGHPFVPDAVTSVITTVIIFCFSARRGDLCHCMCYDDINEPCHFMRSDDVASVIATAMTGAMAHVIIQSRRDDTCHRKN